MKKSALIIGTFNATETGFTGKLDTLAIKANITFERNNDKQKESHPDYTALWNGKEIGAAWERGDDRGHYISVSFEEPSLAPGYYNLTKTGVEKGYSLTFRKPVPQKDKR